MSSLGNSPKEMFSSLLENQTAIKKIDAWSTIDGLNCHLGAPCKPYDSLVLPRTVRRTMSPVSEMASLATFQALETAGLRATEGFISEIKPPEKPK